VTPWGQPVSDVASPGLVRSGTSADIAGSFTQGVTFMEFLADLTARPVQLPPGQGFTVKGLCMGHGSHGLDVLAVAALAEPPAERGCVVEIPKG
jgi:hypothetical protein